MSIITCFHIQGLPDEVVNEFEQRVNDEMSDIEQRKLGIEIAMKYYEGLNNKLNTLKTSVGFAQGKIAENDFNTRVSEIEKDFNEQIGKATNGFNEFNNSIKNYTPITYEQNKADSRIPATTYKPKRINLESNPDGNVIEVVSQTPDYNPYENRPFFAFSNLLLEKVRAIPGLVYSRQNEAEFKDALAQNGFTQASIDLINNYLDNNLIDNVLTEELPVPQSDVSFYRPDFSFPRESENEGDIFDTIVDILFPIHIANEIRRDFNAAADLIVETAPINPDTNKKYTVLEWVNYNYNQYKYEEGQLREIDQMIKDGGLTNMSDREIIDLNNRMRQEFFSLHNLAKKKFNRVYMAVGDELGNRMLRSQKEIIRSKQGDDVAIQEDVDLADGKMTQWFTSINEFGADNKVMQALSRHISKVQLSAEQERQAAKAELSRLIKNLLAEYYDSIDAGYWARHNPFTQGDHVNKALEWMFEKTPDGRFSGDLIARYAANEKELFDEVWEKDEDGWNVMSNKLVFSEVVNMLAQNNKILSEFERKRLSEINVRYNSYQNVNYQSFSDQEKKQYGRDTSAIRRLWVKAKVRQADSEAFVELKREAAAGNKLADAKIKLYDYIYQQGNELMSSTGYEGYPIKAALMPHSEMDLYDYGKKYGMLEAAKRFLGTDPEESFEVVHDGIMMNDQEPKNFGNSNKVPFRTIARKKQFSTNAARIFAHHFDTMIFKKHYDKVLPMMQAATDYFDMQKGNESKDFSNTIAYINEYANQRLFNIKDPLNRSGWARLLNGFSAFTTFKFLAINPVTSAINLAVGTYETHKHFIGELGFTEANNKFKVGYNRLMTNNHPGLSRFEGGRMGVSPLASAVMAYYGVKTIVETDMGDAGFVEKAFNMGMTLQKASDIGIKGIAFLSQFTEEEWNNFDLDEQGNLKVKNKDLKIQADKHALEIKDWIGAIHGRYSEEERRLYHGSIFWKFAMLFKGWIVDYFYSRFKGEQIDRWGNIKVGYYNSMFRYTFMNGGVKALWNGEKEMSPTQRQAFVKLSYDLAIMTMLALVMGGIDDEDEEEQAYLRYIHETAEKLYGQFFMQFSPVQIIRMVKQPFPGLYPAEQLATAIQDLFTGKYMHAGESVIKLAPGTALAGQVADVAGEVLEE